MISDPFPLPVALTVGDTGRIEVGELLVTLDAGALVADGQAIASVTVRAVDGRPVVDNLADLLEATAGRLRAGEIDVDDQPAKGGADDGAARH